VEEIAALVSGGLVDVGAHTETHPLLTGLTDDAARAEIGESKKWLEARLKRPVIAFAYPYGMYGLRDVEIVRHAGFEIAFSAANEAAMPDCDLLQVPRVMVGRRDAAELEELIAPLLGTSPATAGLRPPMPDRSAPAVATPAQARPRVRELTRNPQAKSG